PYHDVVGRERQRREQQVERGGSAAEPAQSRRGEGERRRRVAAGDEAARRQHRPTGDELGAGAARDAHLSNALIHLSPSMREMNACPDAIASRISVLRVWTSIHESFSWWNTHCRPDSARNNIGSTWPE